MNQEIINYFNEELKGFTTSDPPWLLQNNILDQSILDSFQIRAKGKLSSPRRIQNVKTGEQATAYDFKIEPNDSTPKEWWHVVIELIVTHTLKAYFEKLEKDKTPIAEMILTQIGEKQFIPVKVLIAHKLQVNFHNIFNDQLVIYVGQTPKVAGRDIQNGVPISITGPGDIRVFVKNTNGKFPGEDFLTGRLSTDVKFSILVDGKALCKNHGFNGWEPSGKEWWYGPYHYE